jgi:hypothetical protein
MKALNRKVPTVQLSHLQSDNYEFCVCRVLEDCALIKIESLARLRTAKNYMRRIALHVPGSYVVFSNRSKRVLGKMVTHAAG